MSTFSSKENKTGFDQVNFKWRDPELLILPEMSALPLLALQIGCMEEMVFSRQEGADEMLWSCNMVSVLSSVWHLLT